MRKLLTITYIFTITSLAWSQRLTETGGILLFENVYENIPHEKDEIKKESIKWIENNFILFKDTRDLTFIPGEDQIKIRYIGKGKLQWDDHEFYHMIHLQFKEKRARIRIYVMEQLEGTKAVQDVFFNAKQELKFYKKDFERLVSNAKLISFDYERYLRGYFLTEEDDW